eukprot:XP_011439646.1 PREDICTED: uncharacterized protein LOC105336869 [Crassostrea gigas]
MDLQIFSIACFLVITTTGALDDCKETPCQNAGECVPSFRCACLSGWGGEYCNVKQELRHNFEDTLGFENTDDNLKRISAGPQTIPEKGYEGTSHYGKVESGASFELLTNKIANFEIKYCLQFGYFMQGQYTELIVIQENTSDGSETFLWSSESPDVFGTYGWKEFKLSFFGKPQSNLVIKGKSSDDSGLIAIDQIKVHTGNCM